MIGKILCAGVLSAALILLPNPNSGEHINNVGSVSERQQVRRTPLEQGQYASGAIATASTEESQTEPETTGVAMHRNLSSDVKAPLKPETAVTVQTSVKASEPEPQPITENERLMQAAEIPKEDWNATSYIVSKESSWCYKRMNGDHRPCDAITQPTLKEIGNKAYGLCQAYPVTKMASEGADYLTNPITQLRWCHKYAQERYKGWSFAYAFWRANRWW